MNGWIVRGKLKSWYLHSIYLDFFRGKKFVGQDQLARDFVQLLHFWPQCRVWHRCVNPVTRRRDAALCLIAAVTLRRPSKPPASPPGVFHILFNEQHRRGNWPPLRHNIFLRATFFFFLPPSGFLPPCRCSSGRVDFAGSWADIFIKGPLIK